MKKFLALALAALMLCGLASALAEPLELTMYFPVNVGGAVAQPSTT